MAPFLEHYGLSLAPLPNGQAGLRLSREERFEFQAKPPTARHSSIVAAKRAERVIQDVLHTGTAGKASRDLLSTDLMSKCVLLR